jgi:hypothetical protein
MDKFVNIDCDIIPLVLFAYFTDDYILTEEDKEALDFITHSYQYAVVVDIAGILLTVKFLQPHVKDGWLLDAVSYFCQDPSVYTISH